MVDYWRRYGNVPDASVLEEEFRDFKAVETDGDTQYYLDTLKDEYLRTKLKNIIIEAGSNLKELPASSIWESLSTDLAQLGKHTTTIRDLDVTDVESAADYYERLAEISKAHGGVPGIPTGIEPWDVSYPTGLAGGQMIVVIGWSGKAKTWLLTYLLCKAWEQGYSPMVVSLEMSAEQMRDRIYTLLGSGLFRNSDLVKGSVHIDSLKRWGKEKMDGKPKFTIIAGEGYDRVTPEIIQAKIDMHKPDIVAIDYLQLMDINVQGNETVRVRHLSRSLKRMAMSNNIPIINVTQATQTQDSDTSVPPLIEEAAWSRGIQHDADLAIAGHKDQDSSMMEVTARKSRHGELFSFYLDWDIDNGLVNVVYEDS